MAPITGSRDGYDLSTVGGGGSELVYVYNQNDIAPIARLLSEVEGVDFVATKEPVPGLGNPTLAEMGIDHPRSPDIELFMKPGWRSNPQPDNSNVNPLPGNHGHPITQHPTLFVAGGHPLLDDQPASVNGEPVYDPQSEALLPARRRSGEPLDRPDRRRPVRDRRARRRLRRPPAQRGVRRRCARESPSP